AWKFSLSGRSTVILRKPKCVVGKIRLTTTSSSFPSFMTRRVSPSRKSARIFRMSRARSGGISRRLSPRLLRIGTQKPLASMSWTLPLRALVLRFVTTHTDPHIGRDAGVVEELLGQRDQRLQQVVLQNESPDLALAAAGVASEERRAVHDDGDA